MEEKNNKNNITFGTYAVIVTIVFLVLLVVILGGMLVRQNNEMKQQQKEENTVSTQLEDKKETKKEEKANSKKSSKTKKTEKGEKLVQFQNEFFELEKIAKEYRVIEDIKNYKDFNYDLDGDGVKDKITIRKVKDDGVLESSDENEYYIHVFELNGKEFSRNYKGGILYIADLNKNDKKLDVVVFDKGPSDDPNYYIYTKKGNKMIEVKHIDGYPLKTDKKGNFVISNWLDGNFEPNIYLNYYYTKDGKITDKKVNISKIKNIELKSPYMYFTKDIKNLTKFEKENNAREEKELKKFNIEKINNKTFKIISYEESTKKEWENESIPYKLYVQLSDGRKGYVFHIQWAG